MIVLEEKSKEIAHTYTLKFEKLIDFLLDVFNFHNSQTQGLK